MCQALDLVKKLRQQIFLWARQNGVKTACKNTFCLLTPLGELARVELAVYPKDLRLVTNERKGFFWSPEIGTRVLV